MTLSDLFSSITDIFVQLQLWTGLSAPALLLLMYATYKAFKHATSESDNIMGIVGEVGISILFWWLVGYLIINPVWNLLLARI